MLTNRFALTAAATALSCLCASAVRAADMVTTSVSASPSTVAPGGKGSLTITLTFAPGAHVNAHKLPNADFIPTTFVPQSMSSVKVGAAKFPAGVEMTTAGMKEVVYNKPTKIVVPFTVAKTAKPGSLLIGGKLTYQACNTAVCYPPKTVSALTAVTIK